MLFTFIRTQHRVPLHVTAAAIAQICARIRDSQHSRWMCMRGMATIPRVRGMVDVFAQEVQQRDSVLQSFQQVLQRGGYDKIETPIIEHTTLFARSLGSASDVVSKEMYTFAPPGAHSSSSRSGSDSSAVNKSTDDESFTLRPEGTAGVIRALTANAASLRSLPARVWYTGPMFRHERPQRGRLRQFTQIGVECVSKSDAHALLDVECIAAAHDALTSIVDASTHSIRLQLNSLGDAGCMTSYAAVLREYLESKRSTLSDESARRLDRGAVLRVLDSKAKSDASVIAGSPRLHDSLSASSAARFAAVQAGLTALGIPFELTHTLVRGLDYYRHTIFEFQVLPRDAHDPAGQAGTVLAGGRYALSAFGGPETLSAIGWAAGLERLQLVATQPTRAMPLIVAVLPCAGAARATAAEMAALRIAAALRAAGVNATSRQPSGFVGDQIKAVAQSANVVVLVGDDELEKSIVQVKQLDTRKQAAVACSLHPGVDVSAVLSHLGQQKA